VHLAGDRMRPADRRPIRPNPLLHLHVGAGQVPPLRQSQPRFHKHVTSCSHTPSRSVRRTCWSRGHRRPGRAPRPPLGRPAARPVPARPSPSQPVPPPPGHPPQSPIEQPTPFRERLIDSVTYKHPIAQSYRAADFVVRLGHYMHPNRTRNIRSPSVVHLGAAPTPARRSTGPAHAAAGAPSAARSAGYSPRWRRRRHPPRQRPVAPRAAPAAGPLPRRASGAAPAAVGGRPRSRRPPPRAAAGRPRAAPPASPARRLSLPWPHSHPFSHAILAASTRLRAPTFAIASDR